MHNNGNYNLLYNNIAHFLGMVKMKKEKIKKIFSGNDSRAMWHAINSAKTKKELRMALYFVCCQIQELETKIDNG